MRLKDRVRLHILTGFLGSGKSTLLRRYLHESERAPAVVVLINEFGAVAIDHTLVQAYSTHAESLAGGCACCDGDAALRNCLLAVLTQVERGELPGVRDIVLETSGVADPSRIVGTIADEMHLAEYIEVSNCVTVMEVGTDSELIDRFPELQNQIGCASRIVLSKADQHSPSAVERTAALARSMNPMAEIVLPEQLVDDIETLFAPSFGSRSVRALDTRHQSRYSTFQIGLDSEIQWPSFSVWLTSLLHCHGDKILRFKGIVPLNAAQSHALVLQGVRHRVYEPEHIDCSDSDARPSFGLVFICAGDYEATIRRSLANFMALSKQVLAHSRSRKLLSRHTEATS